MSSSELLYLLVILHSICTMSKSTNSSTTVSSSTIDGTDFIDSNVICNIKTLALTTAFVQMLYVVFDK